MRIAIIGCPGSGKSVFSAELHYIRDLPLFHLDQYYFKPNWERRDPQEFKEIHDLLCDQQDWIIDGTATSFFPYRAQKADIIVVFETPLYVCLYRIFKRAFQHFGKVYDFSAQGCQEGFPDWVFFKYVWTFNKEKKPELERVIAQQVGKKIYRVSTTKQVEELLEELRSHSFLEQ